MRIKGISKDKKNKKNKKKFYVRERLPAIDAYIEKLAEGMGLISTYQLLITVLCPYCGVEEMEAKKL